MYSSSIRLVFVVYAVATVQLAAFAAGQSQWQRDVHLIVSQAEQGDPRAMAIKSIFINGRILPDGGREEAYTLAANAADKGSPFGKYALAMVLQEDEGGQKNDRINALFAEGVEGFGILLNGEEDAFAQNFIGSCLSWGNGVAKNEEEAVVWYNKSASQGNALAMVNLGDCYRLGSGVQRNEQQAFRWYEKAAEQAYVAAEFMVAQCYDMGMGSATNPRKAFDMMSRAAEKNFPNAQLKLATFYTDGVVTEVNTDEAVRLIRACYNNVTPDLRTTAECLLAGLLAVKGMQCASIKKSNFNPDAAVEYFIEAKALLKNISFTDKEQKMASDTDKLIKQIDQFKSYPPLAVAWANAFGKEQQVEMAAKVSDPEEGKYGGPPTDIVVKFALGQGNNSTAVNAENAAVSLLMGAMTRTQLKEIKRGEPLASLMSAKVPTGTKMFPVRVVVEAVGQTQNADFYFYKDEFGDWGAISKE